MISVEDRLPEDKFKKYLVKTADGKLIAAFFMPDKAAWRAWYGCELTHWLDANSGKLIYNVTHWIPYSPTPKD